MCFVQTWWVGSLTFEHLWKEALEVESLHTLAHLTGGKGKSTQKSGQKSSGPTSARCFPPIVMEVENRENGLLQDVFSLQMGYIPLPWLWEEGYVIFCKKYLQCELWSKELKNSIIYLLKLGGDVASFCFPLLSPEPTSSYRLDRCCISKFRSKRDSRDKMW